MVFSRVKEKTLPPFLTVQHKILEVPVEDYEQTCNSFVDPYSEEAAQEFVMLFLKNENDSGMVGLVGIEKKGENVVIDAAVRY